MQHFLPCHLMHVHRQRASCHLLTVCTASGYTPRQLHLLPLVGIVCESLWLQDPLPHEYSFVHDTVLLADGDGDPFLHNTVMKDDSSTCVCNEEVELVITFANNVHKVWCKCITYLQN